MSLVVCLLYFGLGIAYVAYLTWCDASRRRGLDLRRASDWITFLILSGVCVVLWPVIFFFGDDDGGVD